MEPDFEKEDYIINCGMCGTPLVGPNLVYEIQLGNTFCRKCAPYVYTCYHCYYGELCDFQTNPSPLPKQVQATTRTGNMTMTQVITNPERIRITCQNGCPCYSAELGCGKEFCIQNRFCLSDGWKHKVKESGDDDA